jgi:hypothetical protein
MENVRRARHGEKIYGKQAISTTSYVSKSDRIPSRKTCRLTVTTIGRRVDDWNFMKKEKKKKILCATARRARRGCSRTGDAGDIKAKSIS